MKIIFGKYRGYVIKNIQNCDTKFMLSKIKEDLFNILDNYFIYQNKIGLDIFAGSGQLGFESLSRGLIKCYFNDKNKYICQNIKKNIYFFKIENAIVFNLNFNVCLKKLLNLHIKFDILFLNPPFKHFEYCYSIIKFILNNNMLNNYGIIICHLNKKFMIKEFNLILLKIKKYKHQYLYFLRKENNKFI